MESLPPAQKRQRMLWASNTAERSPWRALQQFDLPRVLLAQVNQVLVEHAHDSVLCSVDAFDLGVAHRLLDHAADAGIDHRSGPARLSDQAVAAQAAHARTSLRAVQEPSALSAASHKPG
jgi:hypothetical protein